MTFIIPFTPPEDATASVLWRDLKAAECSLLDDPHNRNLLDIFRAALDALAAYMHGKRDAH